MQLAAAQRPVQALARPQRAALAMPTGPRARPGARTVPGVCRALVLVPTGDGSSDHLGEEQVAAPREIALSDGQYEIGREEPAQIVIPYPTVSSRHALLKIDGNSVNVTDLNSTNGTYIGDNELDPMETETLQVGQIVTFGDMYLAKFQLERRD